MHASPTLSRYIGRQFLVWFCLLLAILLAIVLLLDTVELLRRAGSKPGITLGLIVQMALLKLPEIGQQIFPFVILFAAMYTFWKLTRSAELVVARAVGVSAWQFIMPVLAVAAVIGGIKVAAINPVGSVFVARYEQLEERYLKLKTSALDISRAGLWLRQTDSEGQYFVHADAIKPETLELGGVSVFRFNSAGDYVERIDAPVAVLSSGAWELKDAVIRAGTREARSQPALTIPTGLDMSAIEESFAPPETISFWALPRFIATLEETGFPAVRHRIHYQALLAQPLLFCAMVLFAAAFSLRQPRRGGTMVMVSGGVLAGFAMFVLTDIIRTLGMSGTIPVAMAAWSPAGIGVALGIGALLHLEDG